MGAPEAIVEFLVTLRVIELNCIPYESFTEGKAASPFGRVEMQGDARGPCSWCRTGCAPLVGKCFLFLVP